MKLVKQRIHLFVVFLLFDILYDITQLRSINREFQLNIRVAYKYNKTKYAFDHRSRYFESNARIIIRISGI